MDDISKASIRVPALCLIGTATLCVVVIIVGVLFDASIVMASLNHRSNVFQHAATRIAFAIIIAMVNVQIVRGAWSMLTHRNYKTAKRSAILAMIPCVGPCFLLGIPFGVWALVVLNDARVKELFEEID